MATRQYIGARYVVKVYENSQTAGSAEWEEDTVYEPLVLVTYQNGSYLSKKDVPSTVGNPAANTDYWVQTGFYNGQIANLQHQIDTINEALSGYDSDIEDLEKAIENTNKVVEFAKLNAKTLNGNLILNDVFPATDGAPNGSCYIGNNRVVSYFSKTNNNTGILRCYNLSTYSIMWEYAIKGYHGNSVTYNENNNHIYICGCLDNTNNNRLNVIVEIDLNTPSTVLREINLPDTNECYSLCYDSETNKFYSTPYIGTTAGTADIVDVYNDALTVKERTIQLTKHPAVTYQLSSQGMQIVHNNIGYIPVYNEKCRCIYTYNLEDGSLIAISMLPAFINQCRSIGEPESIIYDYDNDNFMVGSLLMSTGVASYWCNNIFEIDLYKGIAILAPVPDNSIFGINENNNLLELWCVVGGDNLKPSWLISTNLVTLPNDGIIYSNLSHKAVNVKMKRTVYNVNSKNYRLANLQLSNFTGRIQGESDADRIPIAVCNIGTYTHANFLYCEFEGHDTGNSSLFANLFVDSASHVFLQNCTFGDFTGGEAANRYHIVAIKFSEIYCYNCTFSGTVQGNALATLGSTITIPA